MGFARSHCVLCESEGIWRCGSSGPLCLRTKRSPLSSSPRRGSERQESTSPVGSPALPGELSPTSLRPDAAARRSGGRPPRLRRRRSWRARRQRPSPPLEVKDTLIGTVVGSFRLVRKLGGGGMGTVYLGEHTLIGSKVAVKFLHEHFASNEALVQRFLAEARAVNLIGHENIINIFDMNAAAAPAALPRHGVPGGQPAVLADGQPAAARGDRAHPHPGVRRAAGGPPQRRGAPRPEAGEHLPGAARSHARTSSRCWTSASPSCFDGSGTHAGRPRWAPSSAPPSTWPPSSGPARAWTAARTSTRWGSSPTSCSPAARRSPRAGWAACCTPTCRRCRRRPTR